MIAIVKTGGKQYKVSEKSWFDVELLPGLVGEILEFSGESVLCTISDGSIALNGKTTVKCEILAHFKGEKVIAFKQRQRHTYRRKKGHRQPHTRLKVLSISN